MSTDSWFVYIVRCADGTHYTGVATDLERRLHQHNHGKDGAKYTRARRPVKLVYHERAENRSAAQQREYRLRRLSAARKRDLIEHFRERLLDLPGENPEYQSQS